MEAAMLRGDIFAIRINNAHSLEKRIKEGNYDRAESFTPRMLFTKQSGLFEACLIDLGPIDFNKVEEAIRAYSLKRPWEPASLGALLEVGRRFPSLQRHAIIPAMGSPVKVYGSLHVPVLAEVARGQRILGFHSMNERAAWHDSSTGRNFLFLATRPPCST